MPSVAELDRLVASFDWDAWTTKTHAALRPHYEAIAREQGQRAADQHDLEWDDDDPFTEKFFTAYLGERVSQLDETTRESVRDLLQSTVDAHVSESQPALAARIRSWDPYAFSPARALTIARTETATAYGHGKGLAFKQNGVGHVVISDGDDDEECAEADGQTWTVDEYLAEPLAHPNCQRDGEPDVEDLPDADDDDEE